MLPPVDDAVLQQNPEFAALYAKLTLSALNSDGSSQNDSAKERRAVTEQLDGYRLKAAKEGLLIDALSNANPQSLLPKHAPAPSLTKRARPQQHVATSVAELPEPLLDLLLLLPPLLTASSNFTPDSPTLLLSHPPLSDLPAHLPQLAALSSSTLHDSAVHLARIANPATNPSYIHRAVPALPTHATSLATSLSDRKADLARARLAAAAELTALLESQTTVLAQLLRVLEAKHGPIARSLEFRAAEAALTAQRQQAEAETVLWLARRDAYPPEAAAALANYAAHLRDARGRMAEAVASLRAELAAYGVDGGATSEGSGTERLGGDSGKEKVMREMARVYRDMGRQVGEVRADLERLGRA